MQESQGALWVAVCVCVYMCVHGTCVCLFVCFLKERVFESLLNISAYFQHNIAILKG